MRWVRACSPRAGFSVRSRRCAPRSRVDDRVSSSADWDRRDRCLFAAGYYPAEWGGYVAGLSGGALPPDCPEPTVTAPVTAAELDVAWGAHVRCVITSDPGFVDRLVEFGPPNPPADCAELLDPSRSDLELATALVDHQDCVFG